MGVFDAVKSLLGSGSDDDSERDASSDETERETTADSVQSKDTAGTDPDGAPAPATTDADSAVERSEDATGTTDSGGDAVDSDPFEYAGQNDGLEDVEELETAETVSDDPATEAVEPDDEDTAATSDEDTVATSDEDTESDDEKISWEETGFEQLTTELVEDDDGDDDSDASDFITEAEPDREEESEFDTVSPIPDAEDDTEQSSATASTAETETSTEETAESETRTEEAETTSTADSATDSEADDAGTDTETDDAETDTSPKSTPPEQRLPLDEEEAEAMTADVDDGPDVDVPEDSKRAELVAEATDLVDFWGEYDLDFTVQSLTRLDDLLDEQWEHDRFEDAEYGGEDYDSEVFTGLVKQIGAYLGEIFVRVHDGEWVKQDGVGWIVDVPAGEDVEVAGAAVTVFHIARQCLTSEMTVAGKYDGLARQLGLEPLAGASEEEIEFATPETTTNTEANRQSVDETAARLQESAEDLAERWPDYDLDFSIASLARLEELLAAELDDERFVDAELGDETDQDSVLLTAHAVGVGGYFGEVLRRERDGEWISDGKMLLVVETSDGPEELDPIDIAVDCIRGERSLTEAVPDAA